LCNKVNKFTIVSGLITTLGGYVGRKPKTAKAKAEEQRQMKRLGKHLRELREEKSLTPQDLANKLGVTPQYIYMIESGKARPTEKRLNDLASALGDLADEFLTTALKHVEDEFALRLKEAGLSPAEIDEAARRVSARVKEDVVSGKEQLRVARGQASEEDILGALDGGESIVAMEGEGSYLGDKATASEYAQSVKQEFETKRSLSVATAGLSGKANMRSSQTIRAGRHAQIVVDRPVSEKEMKALQDIGRVIAHLLKK
jgi:transcriptional regulator with XRE-family HTH domain